MHPVLDVLPERLEFSAIEFGQNPDAQVLTIKNIGFGELNWEIILSEPQVNWLNIEPFSGKAITDAASNISISVDISEMEPGQFVSQLEISSDAGSKEIEIILDIQQDITPPDASQILSPRKRKFLTPTV